MSDINEELAKWFEKLQTIPVEHHLLCPKISDEDFENYRGPNDPISEISAEERKKRIQDGESRIEITYWNSLIFGFDKRDAGKWLDDFTERLDGCLKSCSDCVLNWHMKRRAHLQKFSERWDEDAVSQIQDLLDRLDTSRIDHNLTWAKEFIEKIESAGTVFKKSAFGSHLPEVHIAIYEALCCIPYMKEPQQRTTFQYVFMRLQGKTYLKLGTKDPLPGMTYLLFDQKNEDRRNWAHENWKNIDTDSMTEEQFDWAVSGGLTVAIDDISQRDLAQPGPEVYIEIERFWLGFERILRTLTDVLILSRLRSLEVKPGSPHIYDLLFRHIQLCKSEGVLVVAIRVMTSLLKKSPKAFWDVVGDARPNVITDLVFGSPVYPTLLRQSLDDCWSEFHSGSDAIPFPISWIGPWLQSLGQDRRYDACEVLLHTLFQTLAKDRGIGEPGQSACIRAGFDALSFTVDTFLEQETTGTGTTHLYANCAFNMVMKHKDLLLAQLQTPAGEHVGWKSFHVASAARKAMVAAMRLDMKLFAVEYNSLRGGDKIQSAITRQSSNFWEGVVEMFDASSQQVELAEDFLLSLEPLIRVEPIRPTKKDNRLDDSSKAFNQALSATTDVLARIFSRLSELDTVDLGGLFASQRAFQITVGIAMQGESDLAEASAELLKSWTGELARSQAFEQLAQDQTEQTLGASLFLLEKIMKPPVGSPKHQVPWDPVRPIQHMSRDILRGLCDMTSGVLRVKSLQPKSVAMLLRWWKEQWHFVSVACRNIEPWSHYIANSIMQDFCREIMELAEALIAEDGLFTSAIANANGKEESQMMVTILQPARENFRGMENMIRLKDKWLVEVTVRVLVKILNRLRENDLEIIQESRKLILDACIPTEIPGKYKRPTNLTDQQRAELLQALGHVEEEVKVHQIPTASSHPGDQHKRQSKLDAWSQSSTPSSTSSQNKALKTNRDDVLELSKSIDNPILKRLEAQKAAEARAKAKAKAKVPDLKAISALKESRQREKAEKARRDAEIIAKAKALRGEIVSGEGSSLAGFAVTGKDHSRSEIMVNSSDDESEESDSDDDNQLAALTTGGKKTLDEAERRNRQALRDKMRRPVKKVKQQRSVKEMRARLIPPMEKLHNTILAWDIFHEGNDPPSGPSGSRVETEYSNPRSYQETFFPLLASEAWRSFVTAKDEITSQPFGMKIASRASVDSFLEVTFTMPVVQNKDRGVSEGDILLVSESDKPLLESDVRHCLARVHRIKYKKDIIELTYRVTSRNNPLAQLLTPGVNVHGVKITNMTTIEREYAALESLQYYDLMDEILKAEPSPILRYGDEKVDRWQKNWELNRGQAMAVMGAQENDGFTLIQGPPGTGKTKTIVAMVGALLSDQLGSQNAGTPVGVSMRPGAAPHAANQSLPKKLLVCAPSNAAVDELVLRLKRGIKTINGKESKINVLRLGRSDAINADVKDVTLDELVKNRLEGDGTRDKAKADRDKLHDDAGKIKEELSELRPRLEAAKFQDRHTYNTLSRRFDELKRQQMQIGKQIDANKDSGNSIAREMELRRRQVQQEVLNSAHVLCATLSGSGHEMFRNLDVEFETVLIDEAAQCVELSALIPLKYGCCKCILVGDPKQLPPTVLSQSAARFGYDQSLFVRMQQNHPKSVHLLDMQYRMHPHISAFPSREFYEGQLKDGQDMQRLRRQPWHRSALLGPYRFFDVQGVQSRGHKGQSLVNTRELDVAMQIYDRFSRDYRECDLQRKIGIITPYKAQLFELRSRFKARYGEGITDNIEFNTTDAFQGRECEIIIFSCVRASSTGGIGFMTDIRRMNVGLTRAKSSLWILGDSRALVQGEFWKKLIEDARARDCYTDGDILAKFRKPLEQIRDAGPLEERTDIPRGGVTSGQDSDGDVVMTDIQPLATSSAVPTGPGHPGETSRPVNNPPPVVPRSNGPPVIHTSADKPSAQEAKKRSLSGSDGGQPVAKRAANGPPRSAMMNKFGPKPGKSMTRAPKPPTDPSAMSVLGITPPERPAPTPSSTSAAPAVRRPGEENGWGSSSSSRQGANPPANTTPHMGPAPPRKKPKAKPSLFVPRKK